MTDKVQKIREEVARIQLYTQSEVLKQVLDYIDKVQEEPVSEDILDVSRIDYRLQHKSIEDGIKYHAEEYSFNIESVLYNQLTGEQQKLWRKELERAVISGGYYVLGLSRDKRYKENQEPVSEDLEEAINVYSEKERLRKAENESRFFSPADFASGFKAGAQWQEEHLWKPADGDDLPEIDREVIALEGIVDPTATDCLCGYKVVFAHRPTQEGYDGKSIATGIVEHYTPKTYGKGGWNIPNVKYWLDCSLPNMEED